MGGALRILTWGDGEGLAKSGGRSPGGGLWAVWLDAWRGTPALRTVV